LSELSVCCINIEQHVLYVREKVIFGLVHAISNQNYCKLATRRLIHY